MQRKIPQYVALGLASVFAIAGCGSNSTDLPSSPSGADAVARWPAPDEVAARVADAGLDMGPMGVAEHYHPHLRVVVGGTEVEVPSNVGVDPETGAMSALHTHEPDGTLHIEADEKGEVFTLGQFFTEWGVELSSTTVGDAQAASGKSVVVTSIGKPFSGEPGELQLEPDLEILVTVP